jgi:hypothetical protein
MLLHLLPPFRHLTTLLAGTFWGCCTPIKDLQPA